MDDINKNGENGKEGFGETLENSDISAYLDRREKVRGFKVNIEESADSQGGDEYMSDLPVYKGEVYFSNHARTAKQGQQRQSTGENPLNTVRTPRAQNGVSGHPRPTQSAVQGAPRNAAQRSSSGIKKNKKKRKKKETTVVSATARLLIIIVLCTAILSGIAITSINDVLAINKDSEPVTVEIPADATTSEIIGILGDAGLISRPLMCKVAYGILSDFKKSSAPKYIEGIFYLKASMGLEGMLNKLKETQNYSETVTLSFPEGWSVYQIFNKLEEYDVCDADYLYKAAESVNFNYGFLSSAKSGNNDNRYMLLEGYFFPDTYEFFIDLNANSVIERFLQNFDKKWTDEYAARAKELGLTVDQVIKIASIIQREAANDEQMPQISSVLHNRLNDRVDYPTLDCDSTYNYVTNYVKPVSGEVLADRFMKSYNTYICDGLPAGSICNPGDAAVKAALYPDDTDYYYFQHDSNGKIYLAKTNAEHNRYKDQIALESAR